MKKIMLLVFVLSIVVVPFAFGQQTTYDQYFTKDTDVTFQWDYDFPTDNSTIGFNLYYKTLTTGSIPTKINSPSRNLSLVVKNYPTGSYLNWVTVYDKYGFESDPSIVIQVNKKTIKPSSPTTLRISNPAFVIIIPR